MMVRIDRESLESQLSTVLDRPLREPLRFEAAMPLAGRAAAWWRFVYLLSDELEARGESDGRSATIAQLESLLLTSLLEGQPHNYTEAMRRGDGAIVPRHVRRVKLYIEEHAHEAIGIEDLVEASGVSGRALYEGFQRFCDISPMAHVRNVRMQRAREELLSAAENVTVAQIASRWGFFEFGRFAGQYRKVYGETPSQTLRRRQGP
jgi:transcriptional regulator GlxA family with amidase domain